MRNSVPKKSSKFMEHTKGSLIHQHYPVIIVGGGVAGGYAANQLVRCIKEEMDVAKLVKQHQTVSSVNFCALISDENFAPYERALLTKILLCPPKVKFLGLDYNDFEKCFIPLGENLIYQRNEELNTVEWYDNNDISLFLGCDVLTIDAANQFLTMQAKIDGQMFKLTFDRMIYAAGSRPLFTSFFAKDEILRNVFVMRQIADVKNVVRAMSGSNGRMSLLRTSRIRNRVVNVLVLGGGYTGVEVAAALSLYTNVKVTLLMKTEGLLEEKLPTEISKWLTKWIETRNIKIRRQTQVTKFLGKNNVLKHAMLSTGEKVKADVAVVGTGVLLNSELLNSQVETINASEGMGQAISVDKHMQTTDPTVFAVGDVVAFPFRRELLSFQHTEFARISAKTAMENVLIDILNSTLRDDGIVQKLKPIPYYLPHYSLILPSKSSDIGPFSLHAFGTQGIDMSSMRAKFFGNFTNFDTKERGVLFLDKLNRMNAGIIICGAKERQEEFRNLIQQVSPLGRWSSEPPKFFKNQIV